MVDKSMRLKVNLLAKRRLGTGEALITWSNLTQSVFLYNHEPLSTTVPLIPGDLLTLIPLLGALG
jgi:hypothetical protein